MKPMRQASVATVVIVAGLILTGMYLIAQQYGVWLPDVVLPKRTLAHERTPDGHQFRVVQYVGDLEPYTTDLIHTLPSGQSETRQIAFEDDFAWRVPMTVSTNPKIVVVQVGSGARRLVEW